MPSRYDPTGHSAGEECSSTYEGRHLTILERLMVHPVHDDDLVDHGDPVVVGANIVGVAFTSAAADGDQIAIDTEGIWFQTVWGLDDEGPSAIAVGDRIYINKTDGVLSKITDFETQLPFGYALTAMAETLGLVAVKVHWDPLWWDLYHSNATATADDGVSINVVDTGSSVGMGRALNIKYTQNGAKGDPGEVDGINIDMTLQEACTYAYGQAIYFSSSGDPAIGFEAALSIYMDDPGDACGNLVGIDVGLAGGANSPAGRHAFQRMRNHSAGAVPDCAFQFEGTPNADYFASWETVSTPIVAAAVGGAQTHKIKVRVQGVDYYIPLNTA